jgi:hypothetical protein
MVTHLGRKTPSPDPEADEAPCGCHDTDNVELAPGRIRAALAVLRGHRVVPAQIQAEWLDYKIIFNDILARFGAQLARSAKAEKKRIEKQLALPEAAQKVHQLTLTVDAEERKKELRRRVFGGRLAQLGAHIDPPKNGDS